MSGGRLPKRIVFDLEGAVRRGRGGKEKKWTDCVQGDIRAFGIITGDWKVTVLKDELWVETVAEGGRRLNVAHKNTFVGGDAHPNEGRAAAKANRFRKS